MHYGIKLCRYCVLAGVIFLAACAYRPTIISKCLLPEKQCFIAKEQSRFSPREKLFYTASWRGIPSASLILEIKGIEQVNNRDCYHITANASPNSFFALFFNVKYQVETYVDKDTGLSLKFYKKKTAGNKISEETILFDRDKKIAHCEYGGKRSKDITIGEGTHDLLSFLYFYRMHGLKAEKNYDFNIIYGGKIWPVKMKVNGVYSMKLRNGDCVNVFSVKLNSDLINKIMGSQELDAYVSVNNMRAPIFFTAKTRIGDSDSVLTNLECLK